MAEESVCVSPRCPQVSARDRRCPESVTGIAGRVHPSKMEDAATANGEGGNLSTNIHVSSGTELTEPVLKLHMLLKGRTRSDGAAQKSTPHDVLCSAWRCAWPAATSRTWPLDRGSSCCCRAGQSCSLLLHRTENFRIQCVDCHDDPQDGARSDGNLSTASSPP